MSEEQKAPRLLDEINKEFSYLCAQAGQKQYQITCFEADLKALNDAIRELNVEGAKSKQYYEAKAVEEAKKAKEAPAASNVTSINEGVAANA